MILRNFIVFEGIDGTGTTTQLGKIETRYNAKYGEKKAPVRFTCEPTPGEIGKLIRKALRGEVSFSPDTMARLFAADRGEHIDGEGGIRELLEAGCAVFSDRYLFSSLAYQGQAGDPELPAQLNQNFPLPEYLFFFDIDPETAMNRVEKRAGTLEIYEKRDFQTKVRERYLAIIARLEQTEKGMQVIRIEAAEPVETITEKIWSIVQNLPKI